MVNTFGLLHCGKSAYSITSSACAGNAAHRLSRRGGAGGAPRRPREALARIIASNAPIAVRGMKRTSTRSRATSSTKPPPTAAPRDPARRQSAGRQRRLCREASAAVLRRGPPFRNRSSVCRAPEIGTHAATPTRLPIRILQLCPAVYLHLTPKRCCEQKIHLAVANVWICC